MRFEMDTSQLKSLSRHFALAGPTIRPLLDKALEKEVRTAAAAARASAPVQRPWLSTPEGLRVVQKYPMSWSIVSPRDPRGQSVGYRVVYGTRNQAPNDFVTPHLQTAGDRFNKKALAILVTGTI